ncbi:MAG: hypothetical protein EOO65_02235 [Methanosarcinales archaeon]|nr:MAG: hypothetical protein EOO65_02235 [Methanosarcinales archaeon]
MPVVASVDTNATACTPAATYDPTSPNTTFAFTEGTCVATISDADDTHVVRGEAKITTAASAGNYAACDPTRDLLELATDYASPPKVFGVWAAATCTLQLVPAVGSQVTLAEMAAALNKVAFRSLDPKNPTNYVTSGDALKRQLAFTVTDASATGLATQAATSAAKNVLLTITQVDGRFAALV